MADILDFAADYGYTGGTLADAVGAAVAAPASDSVWSFGDAIKGGANLMGDLVGQYLSAQMAIENAKLQSRMMQTQYQNAALSTPAQNKNPQAAPVTAPATPSGGVAGLSAWVSANKVALMLAGAVLVAVMLKRR
jgi:hypothetical protein